MDGPPPRAVASAGPGSAPAGDALVRRWAASAAAKAATFRGGGGEAMARPAEEAGALARLFSVGRRVRKSKFVVVCVF